MDARVGIAQEEEEEGSKKGNPFWRICENMQDMICTCIQCKCMWDKVVIKSAAGAASPDGFPSRSPVGR